MRLNRVVALLSVTAIAGLGLVGCGSDGKAADTTVKPVETTVSTSSTMAESKKLIVLVSNDDGYSAPGIDALVRALEKLPDTEVIVSAPATQQSGKGSNVTEGELTVTDARTQSGYPVHAVAGTPADSVNWALNGGIEVTPDVVVTGINQGQNLGAIGNLVSGTVGAARAAVAHGIPALATSMGVHTEGDKDVADYPLAATFVVNWLKENRAGLLDGKLAGDSPLLENLNVPSCNSGGEPRGPVEVKLADSADGALEPNQNCKSTVPAPADDITAFNNGFVTLSTAPAVRPAN